MEKEMVREHQAYDAGRGGRLSLARRSAREGFPEDVTARGTYKKFSRNSFISGGRGRNEQD
jgi:hypothetical protein